jgi:tocopherol O-methyltransferase
VARHYDVLDRHYREIWGEHLHHGLWLTGHETVEEATAALVDLVADRAGVGRGTTVCDVGCGYGATARALAVARGAVVTGLTVSEAQFRFAEGTTEGGNPHYLLSDWLHNDLPSASFDAVVAIESVSHMGDKPGAFRECRRVLRPGGRLVVCDWLAGERAGRELLLRPIRAGGRLPHMCTFAEYAALMRRAGFEVIRSEDLSPGVRRTWPVCRRRLLARLLRDPEARRELLSGRNSERRFGLVMALIPLAYRTGAIRYGMITARASDRA